VFGDGSAEIESTKRRTGSKPIYSEMRYNRSLNDVHRDAVYRAIIMKVIVTVIDDRDVDKVMGALTDQHIGVTRISSTGDFIAPGNSTLLIGVDEQIVPRVMQMIVDYASPRQSFVPVAYDGTVPLAGVIEAQVGGFLSFVLDVEHFEQV